MLSAEGKAISSIEKEAVSVKRGGSRERSKRS